MCTKILFVFLECIQNNVRINDEETQTFPNLSQAAFKTHYHYPYSSTIVYCPETFRDLKFSLSSLMNLYSINIFSSFRSSPSKTLFFYSFHISKCQWACSQPSNSHRHTFCGLATVGQNLYHINSCSIGYLPLP